MTGRTSALLLQALRDEGFEFDLVPDTRRPLGVRMKVPEHCTRRRYEAVKALVSDERFRLAALLADRDVPEATAEASTSREESGPMEPTRGPEDANGDPDSGAGPGGGM